MQATKNYLAETVANIEHAVLRMQPALHVVPVRVPLPTTPEEISRYVENLLSDEEQRICDMATD